MVKRFGLDPVFLRFFFDFPSFLVRFAPLSDRLPYRGGLFSIDGEIRNKMCLAEGTRHANTSRLMSYQLRQPGNHSLCPLNCRPMALRRRLSTGLLLSTLVMFDG